MCTSAPLAAAGATNPQIAQALFVTVKTVESHLAGAYRKLDIKSRRELPAALAKQDERRPAGTEPTPDVLIALQSVPPRILGSGFRGLPVAIQLDAGDHRSRQARDSRPGTHRQEVAFMFRFFSARPRLAAVAAVTLTAAAGLPASAAALIPLGSKTATTKNSLVTAQCGLTVKNVNQAAGTETIQLRAEAKPTGLAGYFNTVHTEVDCTVNYLHDGILIPTYFSASANGPLVSTSTTEVFPTSPRFEVCAQATVTQKNGDTTTTPMTCSG